MNQKRIKKFTFFLLYLFLVGVLFFPFQNTKAVEEEGSSPSPTTSPTPTETATPSPTTSPTPTETPTPSPSETPKEKSSNAYLSSLAVTGYAFTSKFNKDTLKYTLNVTTNVSSIEIKGATEDSKASVSGLGKQKVTSGTSIYKITVTAEDGTSKTYQITVNQVEANLNLKSLKITGQVLNETFNPDILKYTATVPYEIEELKIQYIAETDDVTISVAGGSGLKVGENTVTVTVKSSAGDKRVYTILVTREEEQKQEEEENNGVTSSITSNGTSNGVVTPPTKNTDQSDLGKYILVSIGCLVLFAIGGIGIYFYIKTGRPRKRKVLDREGGLEESPVVIAPTPVREKTVSKKEIYNYEGDHIVEVQRELEDTIEFDKGRVVNKSTRSAKHDDVLADIEDLFEDD